MRTEEEMMQQIYDVADSLGVVKAIALNGSRVYLDKDDDLQDFDIVYFVPDDAMQDLIDNQNWINQFGERLILQTPMDLTPKPIDYTKRFNFLMLFKDETRLDLGLVPLSQINVWAKQDSVAKVLRDPESLLEGLDLKQDDSKYFRKKPTQGAFMRHSNEFWWTIPYVVKGILRNQFIYAADHYYENVLGEFLIIIEWTTAAQYDFKVNLGKNLGYLLDLTDVPTAEKVMDFVDFGTYEKMANNLIPMMQMFDEKAKAFVKDYDYEYNTEEAQNIMNYTKEKLADYLN